MSEESELLRQQIAEMQAERMARDRQVEEERIAQVRRFLELTVDRDAQKTARLAATAEVRRRRAAAATAAVWQQQK